MQQSTHELITHTPVNYSHLLFVEVGRSVFK